MEWQFLLGLGAITIVVIGLVIYFGMKLNKAVLNEAPAIALPIAYPYWHYAHGVCRRLLDHLPCCRKAQAR